MSSSAFPGTVGSPWSALERAGPIREDKPAALLESWCLHAPVRYRDKGPLVLETVLALSGPELAVPAVRCGLAFLKVGRQCLVWS